MTSLARLREGREIITLYLEGYLTPEIAVKTKHSKEAVDRYIADYHRVEILWKHGITTLEEISRLSRLSKRVAVQYVDLLPEKLRRKKANKSRNESQKNLDTNDDAQLLTPANELNPAD